MVSIPFTQLMFGTITSILVLHEVAHSRRLSAIGFGFIVVLIIIRPGFQEINMGILFGLAVVLIQTGNTIITRLLTGTGSPNTIAFYHSLVMIPVAIVPALIVWITPTLEQWCWLITLGVPMAC